MDYIRISQQSTDNGQQTLSTNDVKELLKDWIKLYPNSFSPDMEFKIYQLEDGDIIIRLHEDMSSLAVALLVLYLESTRQQVNETISRDSESRSQQPTANSQWPTANSQQPIAYISIDDTEVVLKQNIGKRAMLTTHGSQSTTIRILLDDNYVLDYDFERKPQPVKDSELQFEETEFTLPEEYESVVVGDVVKKEIDKVLEDEGLTPKKLMWYLICGAVGLAIGFLIVYLTGK